MEDEAILIPEGSSQFDSLENERSLAGDHRRPD